MRLAFFLFLAACRTSALEVPETACSALIDEASCSAVDHCRVLGCCGGFLSCYDVSELHGTPSCPAGCAATTCKDLTDEATCDARADCHATFVVDNTLDCGPSVPDCDIGFHGCADGAPVCTVQPPDHDCEDAYPPVGRFVPEYGADGCQLDYVRSTECP